MTLARGHEIQLRCKSYAGRGIVILLWNLEVLVLGRTNLLLHELTKYNILENCIVNDY